VKNFVIPNLAMQSSPKQQGKMRNSYIILAQESYKSNLKNLASCMFES